MLVNKDVKKGHATRREKVCGTGDEHVILQCTFRARTWQSSFEAPLSLRQNPHLLATRRKAGGSTEEGPVEPLP